MPIHLLNEHNIIVDDNANNDTMRTALERVNMLIDYFKLNNRDDEAKQYLYTDIPIMYFKKL